MIQRLCLLIAIGAASISAFAAPSILDIKHSITDNNIIAPESFETKTRELEQNFYLKTYTEQSDNSQVMTGTAKEYEELLSRIPAEIEMPYNAIVGKFIDMYLGKRRNLVADMLALHNYYGKIFLEELIKEKMPLELQYLPVIESALNPNAVSRAGAAGLWQFMPATATGLGLEVNSLVDQRRDPRLSSRMAVRYLKQLYEIYGDWSLAIAAYNCGPGNVNKALRRAGGGKKDFWEIYNYLLSETRGYLPAFIAANYVMTYYNRYGIRPTLVKQQLVTDTVQVNHRVHFNQIAEVLNIPIDEIRMLNPQFRKDIIPGDNHPYQLVLPSQQCLSYIMSEDAILAHDSELYARRTYVEPGERQEQTMPNDNGESNALAAASQTQNADGNNPIDDAVNGNVKRITHKVGRGENLRDIAKKYGVSATDIKRLNKLRRGKVKEGDSLVIEVVERKPTTASSEPMLANNITAKDREAAERGKAERKELTKVASTSRKEDTKEKTSSKAKKDRASKVTTYKVKSGDTLEKIAKKHGTTIDAIRQANGMSKGQSRINIGQSIKIPSKGASVSKSKSSSKKKKGRRRSRR
ncbi:MAG: transglycosylase SLT domain-containing protein [Paramuribaculum sp.]|nr:transglycosylase SLT domain-containing protein [Paramuribaculum sp.]